MAVAAKFWVQSVTKRAVSQGHVQREVVMAPVVRSGDGDNVDWSKYTPSGEIRLSVTDDGAGAWFEEMLGQDVAITFDKAPAPE